jgi:hypothetical protein
MAYGQLIPYCVGGGLSLASGFPNKGNHNNQYLSASHLVRLGSVS